MSNKWNFTLTKHDPRLKRAFGDPIEKAKVSRDVATWAGRFSAGLAMVKNVYAQIASKVLGGVAAFSTYNVQLLDVEAGAFQQEGLIVDTLTTFTEYCKNPIGEVLYDVSIGAVAPFLFEYGEYKK